MQNSPPSELPAMTSMAVELYHFTEPIKVHMAAGGIGSMRQKIRCWKSYRQKRERHGEGCGLIRSPYRRGSGDGAEIEITNGFVGQRFA
jgi:hypothetical protein